MPCGYQRISGGDIFSISGTSPPLSDAVSLFDEFRGEGVQSILPELYVRFRARYFSRYSMMQTSVSGRFNVLRHASYRKINNSSALKKKNLPLSPGGTITSVCILLQPRSRLEGNYE